MWVGTSGVCVDMVVLIQGPQGMIYALHRLEDTGERRLVKVFWSSGNRSFVFNQIFVYGTLMGVDYKSEKKI